MKEGERVRESDSSNIQMRMLVAAILLSATQIYAEESVDIPYESFSETYKAIAYEYPNGFMQVEDWMTVLNDVDENTQDLWHLTTERHYAYPSVVRRIFSFDSGIKSVRMAILCEADPKVCSDLRGHFQKVNQRLMSDVHRTGGDVPEASNGIWIGCPGDSRCPPDLDVSQ